MDLKWVFGWCLCGEWQPKPGGCVTIYPEPCPEKDEHCVLCYLLLLFLLLMICCGTYASVYRTQSHGPPHYNIRIENLVPTDLHTYLPAPYLPFSPTITYIHKGPQIDRDR